MLNRLVPKRFKDYLKEKLGVPDMFSSFKNMKRLGFYPKLILDVGAYEGTWSEEIHRIFPLADIIMFEGQTEKEGALARICGRNSKLRYEIALLGASPMAVKFNKYETASSVFSENNTTHAEVEMRTLTTLDTLTSHSNLNGPILLKIDTQGYELEILKGSDSLLQHIDVVLLEVSMLNIYLNSPLVNEVLMFMKEKGFYLYDICSLIRRPLDNALYQSDFIFVTENFLGRDSTKWSG